MGNFKSKLGEGVNKIKENSKEATDIGSEMTEQADQINAILESIELQDSEDIQAMSDTGSAYQSRVALLRSMGIEASAEYVPVDEDGTNGNLWTAGGFSALDLSGEIQSYQGGNSEGLPSDGVVASPIGGGLTSAVTSGGISIGDARKTQSVESDQYGF